MAISNLRRPFLLGGPVVLIVALLVAGSAQAGLATAFRIVLQKGRHYDPTDLFLRRGDTITLVNGDDNAVHHAFIEAHHPRAMTAPPAAPMMPARLAQDGRIEGGRYRAKCAGKITVQLPSHAL